MGSVPAAHCEDILACRGRCGNIWKKSLPCVADRPRLSHSGHFAHLTLVSDDRSARDRELLKALSLLYMAPCCPRIFTLACANSSNSARVLPFYFINWISEPSTTPHQDTLGLFPFSHVTYFVFSWRAISFSHHSITHAAKPRRWVVWSWQGCASPLLPDRTDEREQMRMEMWLTAWTQTVVCIYPQQQQQLLRDSSETAGGK